MRIKWLPSALHNLSLAVDYIAYDDPAAAERVARRIQDAVRQLGRHPFMGKPNPHFEEIRDLAISGLPYIIRYRVQGKNVEILRIHHSAQRWPEDT